MEFSPNNPIIQLCLKGMALEDAGKAEEAHQVFLQAWNEATNDFEKYTAAFYVSRHQPTVPDKLQWLESCLALAQKLNNESVNGALPLLYSNIATCYEEMNDMENFKKAKELAKSFSETPADEGPFYHGTKADLNVGDQLCPGGFSNYQDGLVMNHIYFTANKNGAGLAAALAKGTAPERVYKVMPTGSFENDPNVTNKKFPGNPSRSYRTLLPLTIVGEESDWQKQTPEDIQKWREKLDNNTGEIIN